MPPFVAGQPDVILICVKSCSSRALLMGLGATRLPAEVVIVSCQNGLDVEEQIAEVFGSDRGIRMVLNMGCNLHDTNNVVVHFALPHFLSPTMDGNSEVAKIIAGHLTEVGFATEMREDYRALAFKKAILNIALGAPSALTRMTMQEVMEEPGLYNIAASLVREGIAVAQGLGLGIGDEYFDEAMDYLSKGGSHKPSILVDIEEGKRTENEYHCGNLLRNAKYVGVEVPVASTIYCLIKALEKTVRRARLRDIPR